MDAYDGDVLKKDKVERELDKDVNYEKWSVVGSDLLPVLFLFRLRQSLQRERVPSMRYILGNLDSFRSDMHTMM